MLPEATVKVLHFTALAGVAEEYLLGLAVRAVRYRITTCMVEAAVQVVEGLLGILVMLVQVELQLVVLVVQEMPLVPARVKAAQLINQQVLVVAVGVLLAVMEFLVPRLFLIMVRQVVKPLPLMVKQLLGYQVTQQEFMGV